MNLSKKTLLYSSIISVIIVSLILGYFIFMLPSLYVDYMQGRNYASVVELHRGYMKEGSYDKLEVKNPTATITLEIPLSGDFLYIVSKFFRITIEVKDPDIRELLEKLRYYAKHEEELRDFNADDLNLAVIEDKLLKNQELPDNYPLGFDMELFQDNNVFLKMSSKFHIESEDLMVYEANVSDGHNYYTTYIALGFTKEAIDITFIPVVTPRIDEIRPVVFQSLPMFITVALLLVLVSSQVFSKLIVYPIIKLANHAQFMREAKDLKLQSIKITGRDEISSLGESLNGLYERIQESYQELEVKNSYLAEENKRQEVFLRASSHQLKTPITAALLLVQGMINEVGKYKDVKEYLPQVKQQLLSMQKIVEDILQLNHCSQNLQIEPVIISELMEECLSSYRVQINEKRLNIISEGLMPRRLQTANDERDPDISSEAQILTAETDRELMKKLLDSLLSNAIHFTPAGGRIELIYENRKLCIINYGVTIEEELLPHVFEPFVTSNNSNKAHGLGLYIVSYYAKLLHCQVKLSNINHGVMAELIFHN